MFPRPAREFGDAALGARDPSEAKGAGLAWNRTGKKRQVHAPPALAASRPSRDLGRRMPHARRPGGPGVPGCGFKRNNWSLTRVRNKSQSESQTST